MDETDKQSLVTSFLEIAAVQNPATARQFLQATGWKLDEALQLYFVQNDSGVVGGSSSITPPPDAAGSSDGNHGIPEDTAGKENAGVVFDDDEVRAPLPAKRDVLYADSGYYRPQAKPVIAFRNFEEELKRDGVWEADKNATSTATISQDNLASLYRPPFALMHRGPFDKAKLDAALQDKWLIVNVQSTREFHSHMLNRDTWGNEAVAETIGTNFIFWQVYDDVEEGSKICTYYNLIQIPAVLVIDPITGQKIRAWTGMVQPEHLLENLLPYMDKGPKEQHIALPHKRPREMTQTVAEKIPEKTSKEEDDVAAAVEASMEDLKDSSKSTAPEFEQPKPEQPEPEASVKTVYLPLPEEPKGDKSLISRVVIRFPDGRRLQRNFLRSDPIQLLWSFCCTKVEDAETRPFRFTQAIPGASKFLDYGTNLTFEESGISNSVVSFTWE
ncbi:hypothetical protein QJS10_CPA03g02506 [Acorus calamus]|uniref:UBX domain-containing protein n=1 Tax=Acorus calamus TaxID=4465 RepID=A0AAV9FB35_ACOCL|nr:hypothetical protein QJS10_CPA03g02506 [Acorus calamus]